MPHAEMHDAGPQLNPHGRRIVEEVLTVARIIAREPDMTMRDATTLTLAAYTAAGADARLLHDPRDPMSRAG